MSHPTDYKTPNSLAAIWSMMLPGLGQMMKGQILSGIIWGLIVACSYIAYFWPGLVAHTFCILDAGFNKGDNSWVGVDTWPKRLGLLATILFLVFYIFIRNF